MEEKKFTEKESLELISHMIQATRKNLVKDQGNYFIIYGYTAAILSVIIYTLLCMTPHPLVVGGLVSHVPTGNRPRVQRKKELPDRRHLHGQHGQQSLASGRHLILVNRAGHAGLITPCWKV